LLIDELNVDLTVDMGILLADTVVDVIALDVVAIEYMCDKGVLVSSITNCIPIEVTITWLIVDELMVDDSLIEDTEVDTVEDIITSDIAVKIYVIENFFFFSDFIPEIVLIVEVDAMASTDAMLEVDTVGDIITLDVAVKVHM